MSVIEDATQAVVEELGLIWPDECESMHEDIARRVLAVGVPKLAQVRAVLAKSDSMRPDDFKINQEHLSPAFREVDYQAAFMALVAIVIEAQTLLD
jgi:hypothetical protein